MTRGRKWLLGVTAFLALAILAFTWLITTESGARWALARAEAFFPEPLTIESVSGTLLGGLDAENVAWNDDAADVLIERVFVDVRILPLLSRRVYVDRLDVTATTVALAINEDAAQDGGGLPEIRLPIDLWILDSSFTGLTIERGESVVVIDTANVAARMRGSDLEVSRLQLDGEGISLAVEAQAQLAGDYAAAADVEWRWTDELNYAGRLRLAGDLDNYEVEHTLEAPVIVESSGAISMDPDEFLIDLEHEWQDLEWRFGEHRLKSASGTLLTSGGLSGVNVALDVTARFDAMPESRILLVGHVDATRLNIGTASLVSEAGQLEVRGDVFWTPEVALAFRLSKLDPSSISSALTGEMIGIGRVTAVFPDGEAWVSLQIDEISGQLNGADIGGGAEIEWADSVLSLTGARLFVGDNRVDVDGSVGETASIDVGFEFDAIEQLLPEATGSLDGRLNVSGPLSAPELELDTSGSELGWRSYRVGSATIDSTIRQDGLSIVDVRASRLFIGDETIDELEASVSGSLEQHRFNIMAAAGEAGLAIGAVGGVTDNRWLGEIATFDIDSERFGSWASDASSVLALAADSLELGELCVVSASTDGRLCADATMIPGGDSELNLEIDSLPIAALPLGLPETTRVDGSLDARIGINVSGTSMNGTGGIGIRDGRLSSLIDGEELTVSFANAVVRAEVVDNRGAAAARFELDGGGGSASIDMRSANVFDLTAPVEGQATLSLADADLFAFLLPALSDPYGLIEGTIEIGGTPAAPEFAGALTLSEGRFAVREAGIVVFDVNARVEQRSTGRLRLSGSGRSGEGTVSIEGETIVGAETGIRSEVRIRGENFELMRLPDWQLAASPDVGIVFDDRSAVVTGTLDIPRAAITLREIPESAVSASPDVVVHRPGIDEPAPGRTIGIDVDVSLGEEVGFSGFGLETGLEGALRVRGGTDAPYTGVGRLSLSGGRYEAYGQELDIELGNLIFNGPLDEPQLDVRAVRRAGDVTAGILLTGTPEQLRSELVSDPPMSDAEALSYLLTGRPLESATDAGEGDTLNQAAFALGLSGAGSIVSQIRSDLGLDTLSVEGGASNSRIVAGKQISERLFVEYGYGLIDQLGELLLRYQLNDRLILESRTGSVSNLDIVYSVKKE